jgi:hypothetical protein
VASAIIPEETILRQAELKRPTTLEAYRAASAGFATEEGIARGLTFRPRPSDVFIATYAKAGTTWMQQIVHGLRTSGSMDFGEITEVVPWIELAADLDLDPEAEQPGWPRAYKTHLTWPDVPKGGRYIAIVRHPYDVALSLFRFMEGWFFETGSIDLATFIREDFLQERRTEDYWHHVLSWWQVRQRDDVLFLTYEGMRRDLPGTVARVAGFIGLAPDGAHVEVATRQAGFDFMKRHAGHFDDHLVREKRDAACGLPPGGDSSKVREGGSGGGRDALSPELRTLLDAAWHERVTPATGLNGYEALEAVLAQPQEG